MSADPPPLVSVIIPTYNWSEALRCAVQSARLQTLENIEILVMGDGCTDASEAVVRAFGDPRIRWTNLDRHGHQWAPNNVGLRQARGEWIAYLGHDDIWYPTHLESALRVAALSAADLVAGVSLLYGPPGSGVRAISGVFQNGRFEPPEWAPPPALVHRRSLVQRAGYWKDPYSIPLPSDVDFVKRLLAAGARTATTNELTLFKFNAGRKNTYRIKTNDEQRVFLDKVSSGVDFRQQELFDFLRAREAGRTFELRMPDATGAAEPGQFHRSIRRLKGLLPSYAEGELLELRGRKRFRIWPKNTLLDWHRMQLHPIFGPYRWSGPALRSALEFPVRLDRPVDVLIHVLKAGHPDLLPPKIFVAEVEVPSRLQRTRHGTFLIQTRLDPQASNEAVHFTIGVGRTVRPGRTTRRLGSGEVGLAISWVELAAASR